MAAIGNEMERMEDIIHDLRAKNDIMRSIIQRAKVQVPEYVWTWHEDAKEALK